MGRFKALKPTRVPRREPFSPASDDASETTPQDDVTGRIGDCQRFAPEAPLCVNLPWLEACKGSLARYGTIQSEIE